jgi:hypothetical protein
MTLAERKVDAKMPYRGLLCETTASIVTSMGCAENNMPMATHAATGTGALSSG